MRNQAMEWRPIKELSTLGVDSNVLIWSREDGPIIAKVDTSLFVEIVDKIYFNGTSMFTHFAQITKPPQED
jgi:hypothetical protein